MSNKAMKWAWETDLPSSLKIVLVALADCHNTRTGQCNPRVETLAAKLGKSKRAVQYNLKDLEERGYIHKIRRRKGPRQASNQYVLALDGVVFQSAKHSTLKQAAKCRKLHPESVESCTLYREPKLEPKRARPSNVVKFNPPARKSTEPARTADVLRVEPLRSAEKAKNRDVGEWSEPFRNRHSQQIPNITACATVWNPSDGFPSDGFEDPVFEVWK